MFARFVKVLFIICLLITPMMGGFETQSLAAVAPSPAYKVATLAALHNTSTTYATTVYVEGRVTKGDGYEGVFSWLPGDQSALVTSDPQEGIYAYGAGVSSGASGVWVRQVVNEIYFSQWFGILGDDSTNNTTAISAMISAVSAGGTIIFSAGTYQTDQFSISKSLHFVLLENAIIKQIDDASVPTSEGLVTIAADDVSITGDGEIYGAYPGSGVPTVNSFCIFAPASQDNILIEGITFRYSTNAAIRTLGGDNHVIRKCIFKTCYWGAIEILTDDTVAADTTNPKLVGNYIDLSDITGVNFAVVKIRGTTTGNQKVEDPLVTHNTLVLNGQQGINPFNTVNRPIITNNNILGTNVYIGISCGATNPKTSANGGANNGVIANNTIVGGELVGIELTDNTNNMIIIGNNLDGNAYGASSVGISTWGTIAGGNHNNLVTKNHIKNYTNSNYVSTDSADNNDFVGNRIDCINGESAIEVSNVTAGNFTDNIIDGGGTVTRAVTFDDAEGFAFKRNKVKGYTANAVRFIGTGGTTLDFIDMSDNEFEQDKTLTHINNIGSNTIGPNCRFVNNAYADTEGTVFVNGAVAAGTTAGKAKTTQTLTARINHKRFTKTATDDLWDLTGVSTGVGEHLKVLLCLNSAGAASIVVGDVGASSLIAPMPEASYDVVPVAIVNISPSYSGGVITDPIDDITGRF